MKKLALLIITLLLIGACSKSENNTSQTATSTSKSSTSAINQPVGQRNNQNTNIFASYSPVETQQLIKQKKDLLIVDVRTPQELREGKIANSVLVPFWNVMKGQHQLPKNRPLLLVCAVGGRSYAAMQILARQGYTELYNLKGGISAWKNAKLPLVY